MPHFVDFSPLDIGTGMHTTTELAGCSVLACTVITRRRDKRPLIVSHEGVLTRTMRVVILSEVNSEQPLYYRYIGLTSSTIDQVIISIVPELGGT